MFSHICLILIFINVSPAWLKVGFSRCVWTDQPISVASQRYRVELQRVINSYDAVRSIRCLRFQKSMLLEKKTHLFMYL